MGSGMFGIPGCETSAADKYRDRTARGQCSASHIGPIDAHYSICHWDDEEEGEEGEEAVGESDSGGAEGEVGDERAADSVPGYRSSCTARMRRLAALISALFFTPWYW